MAEPVLYKMTDLLVIIGRLVCTTDADRTRFCLVCKRWKKLWRCQILPGRGLKAARPLLSRQVWICSVSSFGRSWGALEAHQSDEEDRSCSKAIVKSFIKSPCTREQKYHFYSETVATWRNWDIKYRFRMAVVCVPSSDARIYLEWLLSSLDNNLAEKVLYRSLFGLAHNPNHHPENLDIVMGGFKRTETPEVSDPDGPDILDISHVVYSVGFKMYKLKYPYPERLVPHVPLNDGDMELFMDGTIDSVADAFIERCFASLPLDDYVYFASCCTNESETVPRYRIKYLETGLRHPDFVGASIRSGNIDLICDLVENGCINITSPIHYRMKRSTTRRGYVVGPISTMCAFPGSDTLRELLKKAPDFDGFAHLELLKWLLRQENDNGMRAWFLGNQAFKDISNRHRLRKEIQSWLASPFFAEPSMGRLQAKFLLTLIDEFGGCAESAEPATKKTRVSDGHGY